MITIRDAKPDEAVILSCEAQKVAATPGLLVSHPSELTEKAFREMIEKLMRIDNGRYVVAERDDGVLVGHAFLEPMPLKAVKHIVRLTIAVHEGYQSEGVGRSLMEGLIAWAKTVPAIEKIELNARASNLRAVRLYQSFGFSFEARLRNRVKLPNGDYADDFEMGLFLREKPRTLSFAGLAIGQVVSTRKDVIDDNWDEVESAIELDPSQFAEEALLGLDAFSHVEVLFLMNQVDVRKVETTARHPRNTPEWPRVGIFAQRGKNRPNQIGVTICRLLSVKGRKIRLAGLDAIDGTPVLDLKPWVREFGPRGDIQQPVWMNELMRGYW